MTKFLAKLFKCKLNKHQIRITKIFHSTFLIEFSDNTRILIDPYFGKTCPNCFVLEEKPIYSYEKLPKIDIIFISHEHFDHFDKDAIYYLVKRDKCIVVGPRNVMTELNLDKNIERVVSVDDNIVCHKINIRILPCQHPQSFYPLGFLFNYDNTKIYYAGDTDSLPESNFDAQIGILPAGGKFTADLFVFISMARKLNLKYAIPMHYNTFNMIRLDTDKLLDRAAEKLKDTKVEILDNGKTFVYDLSK